MAEEKYNQKSHEYEPTVGAEGKVESKDRGMFDFLGKKEEEKPQHQDQEVIASEFEKVNVSEPGRKVEEHTKEKEEKKPSLLEKLHRSGSSSSSSSDEEEGDDEEKKKKKKEKKGLKEKLKEKISGEKEGEKHEDTTVPVEKLDEVPHHQEQAHPEEKKGFLDKIKEKLPGQHKKPEDQVPSPPPAASHHVEHVTAETHDPHEGETKEKKGIFEKIKEKLPGYHPKTDEEKAKETKNKQIGLNQTTKFLYSKGNHYQH